MYKSGDIFNSKQDGVFEIISDNGWDKVCYRFPSGWSHVGTRQQISKGAVKDYFKPIYFGVGFIGGRRHKTKINGRNSTAYSRWKLMLQRCYSEKDDKYHCYGGSGVHVCDEWHNFQNYASWFFDNHIEGFEVDKDILSGDVKCYSPSTCMFVSHENNCDYSFSKEYMFISPDGELIKIKNLSKYCRSNGLTQANMRKVLKGERIHHKGYKLPELN